jgi:integrase
LRRRYQTGSLQLRKHGKRKRVWTLLYYRPDGKRGYHTVGLAAEMTKGDARQAADEFMRGVNENGQRDQQGKSEGTKTLTLGEFVQTAYIPFQSGKWKESTKLTTVQRLKQHIIGGDLGNMPLESAAELLRLQSFLQSKADAGLSRSVVKHLRFDLKAVCRLAAAQFLIKANAAPALYTPRFSHQEKPSDMTSEQALQALAILPQRETLILHLAILGGLRPGEILALQRRHVSVDGTTIQIDQRVYDGVIGDPKTYSSRRKVAIAPETAALLVSWLQDAVEQGREAWVFASEAGTPLRPGNLMRRIIRPAMEKVGLGWATFQTMRRTNASLGHAIDPKVMADQRGHGIGLAVDTYTTSSSEQRAKAAGELARKVLQMPEKKTA